MSGYTREQIESLCPTIWDRTYAWGMVNELEADASMPKTRGAKNTKNTLWAHLADIRVAWDQAPLTLRQRQALVLVGGMGTTTKDAGATLSLHRTVVQKHYDAGIGAMMRFLNGDELEPEIEYAD